MIKTLPPTTFVTLSEALSWLAFQDVRNKTELNKELAGNAFGLGFSLAKDKLTKAVDLLCATASGSNGAGGGSKITMLGKFIPTALADTTPVMLSPISCIDLQNFGQFDITIDGLRFGSGLAWLPDAQHSYKHQKISQQSCIAEITVERLGLMSKFSSTVTKLFAAQNGKLPKLVKPDFVKWVNTLTPEERSFGSKKLLEKCNADHPGHHVSRAMIRTLCVGRKRGPKTIEP